MTFNARKESNQNLGSSVCFGSVLTIQNWESVMTRNEHLSIDDNVGQAPAEAHLHVAFKACRMNHPVVD